MLDEAIAAGIDDTETLLDVSQVYLELDESDRAMRALELVAGRDIETEARLLELARIYRDLGLYDEALLRYEQIIPMQPDNWGSR